MSIFDIFKSAPKVVDNVFNMEKGLLTQVGGWVGRQSFSEEEKALHDKGMNQAIQDYSIATMGENTDRSKARRTIAVEWIRLQVWLVKLNVLCVFIDYLVKKLGQGDPNFTDSIAAIAFSPYMWGITGAVSVFFFGSHALRSSKFAK
jgi:hypothetical protein